jgi:hypothetical protein
MFRGYEHHVDVSPGVDITKTRNFTVDLSDKLAAAVT